MVQLLSRLNKLAKERREKKRIKRKGKANTFDKKQ